MRYLIGRYHEVALKGGNRWRFVDQVKHNLRAIFSDYQLGRFRSQGSRLLMELPDSIPDEVVRERGALIFGLQNFSISYPAPLDIDAIAREAILRADGNVAKTFRVTARRDNKRFALNSMEIDRQVGAAVADRLGMKVDLENPELTISIEILPDAAYVSAGKLPGAGGLPVGITGRGLTLLSGGIDSPVAAHRMMKRGLHVDFVHFHGHPLVTTASRDKALELATHLTRFEGRATLMLVPFGILQREIVAKSLRPLRVVMYRRFMLRIAAELARKVGAAVLVSGESLGQVASQTLENMMVIQTAVEIPVLRPLVGMDKNEIIAEARRLGTFETSILPDEDCCTLFTPPHPETHARLDEVAQSEANLEIVRMVRDAVAQTEVVRLSFPGGVTQG
ncbi:MAG TPA: tRNA uracil 4-sulfurtransferase ThiI [Candidatus Binataceae bacterium]|nr:tRNA uracil 4-sulfurtransferase ThiI [Candidatus Binataceae bacterium]